MKKILVLALAALIFIIGCTGARINCSDPAGVSAYLNGCRDPHNLRLEMDRCVAFAGKLCKSASICDSIGTGAGFGFGEIFADATSSNVRNDCLSEVAKGLAGDGDEGGALNACNLIRASASLPATGRFVSINRQAQDQCKFGVAKTTGDVSVCYQIEGVCLREQCSGEFGVIPASPQCPNPRNP